MVQAKYIPHPLNFHRPAGTSRGILHQKECWFVKLTNEAGLTGVGEVSFIPGLSLEDPDEIEIQLDHVCKLISRGEMDPAQELPSLPGIRFALEGAMRDLEQGGERLLFDSDFSKGKAGILVNGLIWMGDRAFMKKQVRDKLDQGFRILKLKVGALDLNEELELLTWIRSEYGAGDLEIRLDANGAWSPVEAQVRMARFARFGIHSIEQPIGPGQIEAMSALCKDPSIPVALDEDLIGITRMEERRLLINQIRPSYLIIKPGLLGGFSLAEQWIDLAESVGAAWWITSALESSIGLSAISQWTYQLGVSMPQGLGTGMLYTNNIQSPLHMEGNQLWYRPERGWDLQSIIDE